MILSLQTAYSLCENCRVPFIESLNWLRSCTNSVTVCFVVEGAGGLIASLSRYDTMFIPTQALHPNSGQMHELSTSLQSSSHLKLPPSPHVNQCSTKYWKCCSSIGSNGCIHRSYMFQLEILCCSLVRIQCNWYDIALCPCANNTCGCVIKCVCLYIESSRAASKACF